MTNPWPNLLSIPRSRRRLTLAVRIRKRDYKSGAAHFTSGVVRLLSPAGKIRRKEKMKVLRSIFVGAVLALWVYFLLAPQLTRGQGIAYLSNTNEPATASSLTASFDIAFTTGTNSAGYLLTSLRVCFKNQKGADFLGDLIGLADKKAHETEISY